MSSHSNNEIPKSLAILGTAVAGALALALVLSSAPVLGGRDSAQAAGTQCSGGGQNSPTPTATSNPGPLPTLTILPTPGGSPSPTGTASPTGSPSATPSTTPTGRAPDPALTTPQGSPTTTATPTGTPSESPITSPPDSTTRCESRITLSYSGNRQRFSGEVRSGKQVCERGRRVLLKRDRKEGRDRTVAQTVTGREGRYQIPLPDRQGRRFYTKTPRQATTTSGGQDVVCLGDRSPTVSTRNPL